MTEEGSPDVTADSVGKEQSEPTEEQESAPSGSSRGFTGSKDRWGFLVTDEFHQFLKLPPEVIEQRRNKEGERSLKWVKMMKKWQKYKANGEKYDKMKRRTRKGIPDSLRGFAWYEGCGAKSIKEKIPDPWKIDTSNISEVTIDEVSH